MPLHLNAGVIETLTQAVASVIVEINGKKATGRGTIYLSEIWAWPDESLSLPERQQALRALCEKIAKELPHRFRDEDWHPLELGLRLHELACCELPIAPNPTVLARSMCASPFDAAIHDAAGNALGRSAFSLYDEHAEIPSADAYFPESSACHAIADILKTPRRTRLPAWYVVSRSDQLEQTLVPAINRYGYYCFKLKISGTDNAADVALTIEVYRKAREVNGKRPRITLDSNEANESAESVLDFLVRLRAADAAAYGSVEYLEQPTDRDIQRSPFNWREVTQLKPVLLDEGLVDLNMLQEARRQNYSGFALKTCKGHSMLLLCAAWAHRQGMTIALQDLTNPGIALIHAALVGSHLPTINGAELNSPQFTPAANNEFLPRLEKLFIPQKGVHTLPPQLPHGLGSNI
jgi:L-alanine-DL-glutamate epimerase-like enolase superfamily enzyme